MYEIGYFTLLLVGLALSLVTLPGTIELIFLTLGAQFSKKENTTSSQITGKLVVIIPAHNEEALIGSTIESIKRCDETVDIVVIADNCSDKTTQIAYDQGARVLERTDTENRGKPYALKHAFNLLLKEDYDWFVIIDGDSEVKEDFITQVKGAFGRGCDVIQTRYDVLHPHSSIRRRLMNIAFLAFNYLRPLGRSYWGLSCGILGNGFGLTKEVIKKVPITVTSVVEDLSYHLQLVDAGYKVHFIPTTSVLGEIPSSGAGVSTQRVRWEGGRFIELRQRLPHLITGIAKGKFEFIEPALDLLLLPLAYHAFILLLLLFFPIPLIQNYSAFAIAVIIYHLMVAIYLGGGGFNDIAALIFAPFYMIWKLALLFRTFSSMSKGMQWKKTERSLPSKPIPGDKQNLSLADQNDKNKSPEIKLSDENIHKKIQFFD